MKKIVILCLGILAELLICFADGYIQRQRAQEALSGGVGAEGAASGEAGAGKTGPGGDGAGGIASNAGGQIRVLIKTAGYASAYHDTVTVASAEGFTVAISGGAEETAASSSGGAEGDVRSVSDSAEEAAAATPGGAEEAAASSSTGGTETESEDRRQMSYRVPPGEEAVFSMESGDFEENNVLRLTAANGRFEIRGLERERESELYEGELELRRTEQGLLLINVLPLEDYLCGVVPSEMPSTYPEEALKAQAVCARTYAKKRIQEDTMLYADVDDSVSYQVYNNQDRTEASDRAVRETAGIVLKDTDGLIDALYYSTSCGLDMDISLSQDAVFAAFLMEDAVAAREAEEPWYRWQTDVPLERLGNVSELSVQSRLNNGAVNVLCVTDLDGAQSFVEGEYSVREYLAGAGVTVTLQDGEQVEQPALLPSAFFILQPLDGEGELYGYHILGGGYGHGIGMSQNGAKYMALDGYDFREILRHYYQGAEAGPE